jgi:hypothetical protein
MHVTVVEAGASILVVPTLPCNISMLMPRILVGMRVGYNNESCTHYDNVHRSARRIKETAAAENSGVYIMCEGTETNRHACISVERTENTLLGTLRPE